MKTAVVTGAGGFIGGALTLSLLNRGYKVYGVDIKGEYMRRFECGQFVPVVADLSAVHLSGLISEDIDVMYYLSWGGQLGGEDLYDARLQMNNVSVAAESCEDACHFSKKFIFASSSYEAMKSESHPEYPFNVYGIAKRAAADLCASIAARNGMGYSKAILTNTYGVGDRSKKAVNTIILAMLNGLPLKLVKGNRPNDWVYIDDTVRGLVKIHENGKSYETYYLGHKEISTFKEKILEMGSVLCPGREFIFGEMIEETYVDYGEIMRSANIEFGAVSDFKESILKTADWVKNNL